MHKRLWKTACVPRFPFRAGAVRAAWGRHSSRCFLRDAHKLPGSPHMGTSIVLRGADLQSIRPSRTQNEERPRLLCAPHFPLRAGAVRRRKWGHSSFRAWPICRTWCPVARKTKDAPVCSARRVFPSGQVPCARPRVVTERVAFLRAAQKLTWSPQMGTFFVLRVADLQSMRPRCMQNDECPHLLVPIGSVHRRRCRCSRSWPVKSNALSDDPRLRA